MDIQTIKVDLIHWLTELQDLTVLEKIHDLKQQQEGVLSDAHKVLLDNRIASYENAPDKVLDWDEVIKELDQGV